MMLSKIQKRIATPRWFGWLSIAGIATASWAQEATPPAAPAPTSPPAAAETVLAITGGDIYTVTQGVIRKGTVIIRDGKIAEIGVGLKIPADAQTIDAAGKTITPGFVAINMQGVGLTGGGGRGPGGGGESGADGNLADQLNPFDRNVKWALSAGITTGCAPVGTGGGGGGRRGRNADPSEPFVGLDPDLIELESLESPTEKNYGGVLLPTCPCCGLTYLPFEPIDETPAPPQPTRRYVGLKMSYGTLDGMLAKENLFANPPNTGLATAEARLAWRQQFQRARDYLKALAEHEAAIKAGERKQPPRSPVTPEFLSLVKKEIPLRVSAESVSQIRDMVSLATELDYRLVIEGATEAWMIPSELADASVSVIVTPRRLRQPRFGQETTTGSFVEMPGILARTGVPFATTPLEDAVSMGGLAGRDLMSLPLEALFTIRGGASEQTALESITIVPARMMGLSDRIGSIEVGKDADLLLLDGSPFDYRTYVEQAWVNGRPVYHRANDRMLPVFSR